MCSGKAFSTFKILATSFRTSHNQLIQISFLLGYFYHKLTCYSFQRGISVKNTSFSLHSLARSLSQSAMNINGLPTPCKPDFNPSTTCDKT